MSDSDTESSAGEKRVFAELDDEDEEIYPAKKVGYSTTASQCWLNCAVLGS